MSWCVYDEEGGIVEEIEGLWEEKGESGMGVPWTVEGKSPRFFDAVVWCWGIRV
jgi:hypothetical protein